MQKTQQKNPHQPKKPFPSEQHEKKNLNHNRDV